MLRVITTQIMKTLSVSNRTQNFFDMNPIYPDYQDKDFDIYNLKRKKIGVIDQFVKKQNREQAVQKMIHQKIYLKKYQKYVRSTKGRQETIDPQSKLVLNLDPDFNDFIKNFKRVDHTKEFQNTLLNLIQKFKSKNQPELIRLFRISIANSRKNSLLDKLRGAIMEAAVLETAKLNKQLTAQKAQLEQKTENSQQIEPKEKTESKQEIDDKLQIQFNKALKEIDDKIAAAEATLRLDKNGFPNYISNYDSKYGYKQPYFEQINADFNIILSQGKFKTIRTSAPQSLSKFQDWSIKSRINRLYFLRKLQYIKNEHTTGFKNQQFNKELPLNIRAQQNMMNELAFKYKQNELLQVPDLDEIYRQIDIFIDKVYIKFSTIPTTNQQPPKIYDRMPHETEFLWVNIDAQQILCDPLYNNESTKNITLTNEVLKEVSPQASTEHSLANIPINLFRHSSLESIGIFNEYQQKIGDNIFRVEEVDFQPTFEQFSLEEAKKKYNRIKKIWIDKKLKAQGRAKRKKAHAVVNLTPGPGIVIINGRNIQDYFGDMYFRVEALKPLIFTCSSGRYNLKFQVQGGGQKGQSECMAYALARALIKINPKHKAILAKFGLAGYDYRQKQCKKINLYSARVRPPYVRR